MSRPDTDAEDAAPPPRTFEELPLWLQEEVFEREDRIEVARARETSRTRRRVRLGALAGALGAFVLTGLDSPAQAGLAVPIAALGCGVLAARAASRPLYAVVFALALVPSALAVEVEGHGIAAGALAKLLGLVILAPAFGLAVGVLLGKDELGD